jgi:ATP-binding cassette subfamily B protein
MTIASSQRRFQEYRQKVRARNRGETPADLINEDEKKEKAPRTRTFGQLLREFLKLLAGHRGPLIVALSTLTAATLLNLVPPLATKLVIDNVLTDKPLPAWGREWGLPTDRYQLLYLVGAFVVGVSVFSSIV